jgi:hypothetical protein
MWMAHGECRAGWLAKIMGPLAGRVRGRLHIRRTSGRCRLARPAGRIAVTERDCFFDGPWVVAGEPQITVWSRLLGWCAAGVKTGDSAGCFEFAA